MGQRAVLYCRVSTADQSCARKERDLTAFAARCGYGVVGVFMETGSGVKLDRVERRKVMALAQARQIDVVLVTELYRWGRSTMDLLGTLRELESRRVSVIAMNGMAFDLATPHGRMIATVLAGIAEFERELIQERIRSGIAAAKARWLMPRSARTSRTRSQTCAGIVSTLGFPDRPRTISSRRSAASPRAPWTPISPRKRRWSSQPLMSSVHPSRYPDFFTRRMRQEIPNRRSSRETSSTRARLVEA